MNRKQSATLKEIQDTGKVRFRLTEMSVDRTGEVVKPDGIRLDNYKNNPIVLFGHGMSNQVPIGKLDLDSLEINEAFVDADIEFDETGDDPFSKMIASKVRNGFLNAGSIGFKPITINQEPVLPGQTSVTHEEWELMEFSIVPIPALPSALVSREFEDYKMECKSLGHDIENMYVPANVVDEHITKTPVPEFEGVQIKVPDYEPTTADEFNVLSEIEEMKDGRVLSGANKSVLNDAVSKLESIVGNLKSLLEKTERVVVEEASEEPGDKDFENDIQKLRDEISIRTISSEIHSLRESLN